MSVVALWSSASEPVEVEAVREALSEVVADCEPCVLIDFDRSTTTPAHTGTVRSPALPAARRDVERADGCLFGLRAPSSALAPGLGGRYGGARGVRLGDISPLV